MASYDFFQNRDCAYFPCHAHVEEDSFNCLFCYCPLYALGEHCGGNVSYTQTGTKDCSACLIPHRRENYGRILEKLDGIIDLAKKKDMP